MWLLNQRRVKDLVLHCSCLEVDGTINYFSLSIMFREYFATYLLVENEVLRVTFWYDFG